MDNSIVNHNANLLWNFSNRNLDVNSQGKLSVIEDWDLCGRIRKFFRNWKGAVTQKIHNAVIQTLDSIETARIDKVKDPFWKRGWRSHDLKALADRIDGIAKFKLIPGIKEKTDYLRILSDRYYNFDIIKWELQKQRAKANGQVSRSWVYENDNSVINYENGKIGINYNFSFDSIGD